jgi:RTX calcium-binding nonapeptide repeat (4 copies)
MQTGSHSSRPIQGMRLLPLLVVGLLLAAGVAGARVVTGTPGNDRLLGTPRADVLRGLGGSDRLVAGRGTDLLHGGAGRDTYDAGPGDDLVAASYDGARDVVRCGAGLDVVNADLVDAVARDCEVVGRRLSRDPYTTADAQHETQVEPDSFTFGRTTVATFQVGRRFDGAATNVGWAVTTNDGESWRSGLLPGLTTASLPPGPNARASDPVVAYDAAHATWLISTLALEGSTTRLAINRSTNGATWSTASNALEERAAEGIAFDKNWLACDNTASSPFYGRCYLVYTHSADRDMLAVSWSVDGGLTWSTPVAIGARPGVGVFPAIRPTGEVVVVYLLQGGGFSIAASRSADGGATWGAPIRIAQVDAGCRIPDFRGFSLPSAEVDRTGRVWASWHDCESVGSSRNNAVFVSTSPDGAQWSAPVAVTRGRNAVLPAIGIDAATGRVAIAYMRARTAGIDVELVQSPGSPSTWSPARRLSAQSMPLSWMPNTTSGRMLADYISVHYARGRPLVVWVLANEPVRASFRQAVYATRG